MCDGNKVFLGLARTLTATNRVVLKAYGIGEFEIDPEDDTTPTPLQVVEECVRFSLNWKFMLTLELSRFSSLSTQSAVKDFVY